MQNSAGTYFKHHENLSSNWFFVCLFVVCFVLFCFFVFSFLQNFFITIE